MSDAGPQPVPVVGIVWSELEQELTESYTARMDDAAWHAEVRRPFTWQRFLNWWVARRWIIPRDIRKE